MRTGEITVLFQDYLNGEPSCNQSRETQIIVKELPTVGY